MQMSIGEEKSEWKYSDELLDRISHPRKTYQPINVQPFMDSLSTKTPTPTERQSMENTYSSQLRRTLKLTEWSRRSKPDLNEPWIGFYPTCPICRKSFATGGVEMHEALITRGDVQGLPFEAQVQIFVPENVTLVHPHCHQKAQWLERGKRIVARDILRWNGDINVYAFLFVMANKFKSSAAVEAGRRLSEWNLWDSFYLLSGSTLRTRD